MRTAQEEFAGTGKEKFHDCDINPRMRRKNEARWNRCSCSQSCSYTRYRYNPPSHGLALLFSFFSRNTPHNFMPNALCTFMLCRILRSSIISSLPPGIL